MLMGEDWVEIVRVYQSIAIIPPFRVDIPTSRQSVRFSPKAARSKANDKVELGEELRPMGLSTGKDFCGRKILKILMVSDHVNG